VGQCVVVVDRGVQIRWYAGYFFIFFFSPPLAVSRILNVNSEEKVKVQLFLGEMWPKCLEFMRQLMEVYICT